MFNNLSIKIKYSIPLSIALIALVVVMVANSWLISKLEDNAGIFPERFMPAISVVLNADRDLYQARVAEIRFVTSPGLPEKQLQDFHENAKQAKERVYEYRSLMKSYPEVLKRLEDFDRLYDSWLADALKVIEAKKKGQYDQAQSMMVGISADRFSALREIYNIAGESAFTKANMLKDEIHAANAEHKFITLFVILIIIVITVVSAIISQKMLLQRLAEIKHGIQDITSGGGDLTSKITIKQKDEIGELGEAFNEFVDSLRGLISAVRSDVKVLSHDSQTLLKSSQTGQQIAEQQSVASDMIVSAVHQMSMSTKELSNIASRTAEETKKAIAFSQDGVQIISNSVVHIDQLYNSIASASNDTKQLDNDSNNISTVLDVIRGIAEQTNLLALNAAIEAARAGEQGRGFAVVADEVRNLAQKTQESTDSIQRMIESLQSGVSKVVSQINDGFEKVASTVTFSKETETALEEILNSIVTVSDMSTQTATATEEQTAVTDDINKNLHDLNEQIVTSKTLASDTNEASSQIGELTRNIEQGVQRFKV